MNSTIDDLIARARAFRSGPYKRHQPLYRRLVREGQSPRIMMVACSDSRVDPSVIFDAEPGQIFMIRNVASLVPPNQPDDNCHGTSAALEFGVRELGVEDIVILGHGHCGGIRALLDGADKNGGAAATTATDYIGRWLANGALARDRISAEFKEASADETARALEYETIRQSVGNLMTFPWIETRVGDGSLVLHGWHFDIAEGTLLDVGVSGEPFQITGSGEEHYRAR